MPNSCLFSGRSINEVNNQHYFSISLISEKQSKFGLKVANVFRLFLTCFKTVAWVNKLNQGKLWAIWLFYLVFFKSITEKGA